MQIGRGSALRRVEHPIDQAVRDPSDCRLRVTDSVRGEAGVEKATDLTVPWLGYLAQEQLLHRHLVDTVDQRMPREISPKRFNVF